MSKERIETGPNPALSVSCRGNLVVKNWDEKAAVGLKGAYELQEKGKVWTLAASGDLILYIPAGSTLHVEDVGGDTVVKVDRVDTLIDDVHGDLVLRGANDAKVGAVHGDASIRNLTGALEIGTVHGDLSVGNVQVLSLTQAQGDVAIRNVAGAVTVERVNGDIDLRSIEGPITVEVGHRDANLSAVGGVLNLPGMLGDIRLKGGLGVGNHVLSTKRDIVLRWPAGTPVNLIATAPTVNNRAEFDEFAQKGEAWIGRIGDSKTNLELTAGRQIQIKDVEAYDPRWEVYDETSFDYDFSNIGERISAQINEKIDSFTRNMEQQFGPDFGHEIGTRLARKAEQAAQRAEKAAERAAQRAEAAAEKNRAKSDRGNRWADYTSPTAAAPPAPAKSASPEEQLKILRMVEKGIISPEDASMLLEALES